MKKVEISPELIDMDWITPLKSMFQSISINDNTMTVSCLHEVVRYCLNTVGCRMTKISHCSPTMVSDDTYVGDPLKFKVEYSNGLEQNYDGTFTLEFNESYVKIY